MKLTIITVVKNDKKNLLISLKNILSQTLKNFEYIICDGMSKDGTKYAIKKYISKNIKYISNKDNNYYEGLNYAISKASGDYIGILNAGDKYCNTNILKEIVEVISVRKYEILFGNLIYLDHKNHYVRFWKFPIKKLSLISALKIASPTLFIKKKLAKSIPYNTSFNISSDTEFNLRLSQKKIKFLYLNRNIIFMRTGGLSTNFKFFLLKIKQDLIILKNFFKITYGLIYLFKVLIKVRTFKLNFHYLKNYFIA
jgi:glycosyltransferase involved in cell wall biosynthesis